jgi:glycosyltransferase involved in cell wall biosynthesis
MIEQQPTVSVIATLYNQSSSFDVIFGLLLDQDYRGSWEILLCDDGSDEDILPSLRKAIRSGGPEVRYVWQPHHGFRAAQSRNNALRCARGQVAILLDGDMAVPTDFVRRHMEMHLPGERRLVYGTRRFIFLKDSPRQVPLKQWLTCLLGSDHRTAGCFSDLSFQSKYAGTRHAWLGCLGCNMSFSRETGELFDESFLGWGAEDQEFACRLAERHGYRLCFEPSIVGLHLEEGSRREYRRMRPASNGQILDYFRNVIHFVRRYPDLDMTPDCNGFGYYEQDRGHQLWRPAIAPNFHPQHIEGLRSQIERLFPGDSRSGHGGQLVI